jgi:phosphopantothenoylcysteine decarboxylase/phosphopantothenate--cysteine ligase
LQALTGKPVFTELWDASIANSMAHIDLSRNVDAILIAPASADFIERGLHDAAAEGARLIVLQIDTPKAWIRQCDRSSTGFLLRRCR